MANIVALDVGTKRIGVAVADSTVPIARTLPTIEVDGTEIDAIKHVVTDQEAERVVVGYPRNQAGEPTSQTAISEAVGQEIATFAEVVYQDESLTSVMAEDRLKAAGKPYTKGDIDAIAATIILQDYLEQHRAA